MAVFNGLEGDYFLRRLECPTCFVTMKPPIYLCPTGHSICSGCFESTDKCSQCDISFRKIERDAFEGTKIMVFDCSQKCVVSDEDGGNRYTIKGNRLVSRIGCRLCGERNRVVAYKDKLILKDEFEKIKAEFRPTRNYSLEAITEGVLYPCEVGQCAAKFRLSEQKEHQSVCIYRSLTCPCSDCDFKGPLDNFIDHFNNAALLEENGMVPLHRSAQRMVKFPIHVPSQGPDFCKALVLNGDNFPDSVFVFALTIWPGRRNYFRLVHYGPVSKGLNINGKVTFFSYKDPSHYRSFTFPVPSDFLLGDNSHGAELPPMEFLTDNHFIDCDGNMTFEIDFCSKEEVLAKKENLKAEEEQLTLESRRLTDLDTKLKETAKQLGEEEKRLTIEKKQLDEKWQELEEAKKLNEDQEEKLKEEKRAVVAQLEKQTLEQLKLDSLTDRLTKDVVKFDREREEWDEKVEQENAKLEEGKTMLNTERLKFEIQKFNCCYAAHSWK